MTVQIYTLKTCDTCKKALKWLAEENIAFQNHDIRADGLERETITEIVKALGWETALNRRSTTWRTLDEADKQDIDDNKAIALIAQQPTLMKRPIFIKDGTYHAGFKPQELITAFVL